MTCTVDGCQNKAVARGLCDKHRKRAARHGHTDQTRPRDWGDRTSHPLYKMWDGMKRRCRDPKHRDYVNYGARGVTVCDRWDDFWVFLSDMGERPEGCSLDRADNSKGYEPSNCRWATSAQQARNRRTGVVTPQLAEEIKRRAKLGERAGDIARSLAIHYDHVRNVIVGLSWSDTKK